MFLVTGGTGFIGRHLLARIPGPVRCLTRRAVAPSASSVEFVQADLVSGAGVAEALRGVDCVIHLAGVIKALRPADYYTGNARTSETLARAAAGRELRFVHVSSLAAVGPAGSAPLTEDAPCHPISDYGKSKLEGEQAVRAILPDAVVIRPPVVYGPADTGVLEIFRSVARGWSLEISGGERWFSFVYVDDLIDGLLRAACHPGAPGRTYFLSSPEPSTWTELTALAARIMNMRPRHLRLPVPLAYAAGAAAEFWSRATGKPGIISRDKVSEALCRRWTCDARRAADELGFVASTSLETGVATTLAWYKEAGWLTY
jgi:dihydroflavonol-4-reductase